MALKCLNVKLQSTCSGILLCTCICVYVYSQRWDMQPLWSLHVSYTCGYMLYFSCECGCIVM